MNNCFGTKENDKSRQYNWKNILFANYFELKLLDMFLGSATYKIGYESDEKN